MNFSAQIKKIDKALARYLPARRSSRVAAAMHYSLLAPGKRIRPILALAAAQVVGGAERAAMPAACAIEMIHAYSLIHDDLPAMDNADLRRGRPTSHKVFGEAIAILAGDALSALAIEIAAKHTKNIQVIKEITEAMGVAGMVGGQVEDILGKPRDIKALKSLHRKKTGALIRAAVRAGAIMGGATARQLRHLTTYAKHLGFTFQIVDDILDVTATFSEMGKRPGLDAREKKVTIASLLGVDAARRLAERERAKALAAIKGWGKPADDLRQILEMVVIRKG